MASGRCRQGGRYRSFSVTNLDDVLSVGVEENCSCYADSGWTDELASGCPLPVIQYSRGEVLTPFTFFLFKRQRDVILVHGTLRRRGGLINVTKRIPFEAKWSECGMIEAHFFRAFLRQRRFQHITSMTMSMSRPIDAMNGIDILLLLESTMDGRTV